MVELAQGNIRRTTAEGTSVDVVAAQLKEDLGEGPHAAVVFFASSLFDRNGLVRAICEEFGPVPVFGCTTAGEIGPGGLTQGSVTAFSLPTDDFTVAVQVLENLDDFTISRGADAVHCLRRSLQEQGKTPSPETTFAFLLIDGLCAREEMVASALHGALDPIPLFGGSAGDGLNFQTTSVFAEGRILSRAAVVALVHTTRPFTVFKCQHISATETMAVVTAADSKNRVVSEINAELAAKEYARMIGLPVAGLTPTVFAMHPVLVRIGGNDWVRSIRQANPDGSLTFYCAIEEGMVLRLAQCNDIKAAAAQSFSSIREKVGEPELIIGCGCILRLLEISRTGRLQEIGAFYARNNLVGFATYGEQFNSMHVNQTLTGVAIGCKRIAG
jgi:hypothetical protein